MVQFLLDDPEPLLYGNEIIYRDGKIVGHLQTGTYGFTLGGSMGMGFVKTKKVQQTTSSIAAHTKSTSLANVSLPKASLQPMYDPKNERVRS